MNIITFINQTKESGKTTAVINIGAALAMEGKKVLLIDLDPQGELTLCMGRGELFEMPTVYEFLNGTAESNEVILKNMGGIAPYDLIPSDIRLSGTEFEFERVKNRDLILKSRLISLKKTYDYILIDTSPNINLFTLMALSAADLCVIPTTMEYASDKAFPNLFKWIDYVRVNVNPKLVLAFGIISKYMMESTFDEAVMSCIYEQLVSSEWVQAFIVNQSSVFKRQRYHTRDIFQFAPKSNAAKMYKKMAKAIINTKKDDWEIDIDEYIGWKPPDFLPDEQDNDLDRLAKYCHDPLNIDELPFK